MSSIAYYHIDNQAPVLGANFASPPADIITPIVSRLDSFLPLSEMEVRKLITNSARKSCSLDPMPTSVVVDCVDVLLPAITNIINT